MQSYQFLQSSIIMDDEFSLYDHLDMNNTTQMDVFEFLDLDMNTHDQDELLSLPFYDDDDDDYTGTMQPSMFSMEQFSPSLEELSHTSILFQAISDEMRDCLSTQQNNSIEEEYETGLSPPSIETPGEETYSMDLTKSSSLVLPRQDMEICNQLIISHLLKAYGDAIENEQTELAEEIFKHIKEKISPVGESVMERFAYYFSQSIDKQDDDYIEQESNKNYKPALRAFYEISPYGRFAHLTANMAILQAMPQNMETILRIIDFDMGEGVQWPPLIEALGGRQRSVILTSIKWKDDNSSSARWTFEETQKRLYDHARALGLNLKVEEMELEELVNEINKMKFRGWLAFNCMMNLPHMGRQRSRRDMKEFLRVAKEVITKCSGSSSVVGNRVGIITYGNGDLVEEKAKDLGGFGSFFDAYILQSKALFESMEWQFPAHFREARTAMECLFLAPSVSYADWLSKWTREIREGCDLLLESRFGLEGWRFSRESFLQAKEMVREGEGLYSVRVEGDNECEMVLEWRGIPLVRVSAWR